MYLDAPQGVQALISLVGVGLLPSSHNTTTMTLSFLCLILQEGLLARQPEKDHSGTHCYEGLPVCTPRT